MFKKGMIMRLARFFMVFTLIAVFITGCDEDDPVAPQEEHYEAIGVVLTTSGIQLASILRGETDDTLRIEAGKLGDHITVSFYNEDEQVVDPGGHGGEPPASHVDLVLDDHGRRDRSRCDQHAGRGRRRRVAGTPEVVAVVFADQVHAEPVVLEQPAEPPGIPALIAQGCLEVDAGRPLDQEGDDPPARRFGQA